MAEDFPEDTNEIKSLTAEQAAKLVGVKGASLSLNGLTLISKDVARELAKFEGIGLSLSGLTSIDRDVAQELAKFEGRTQSLDGVPSRNKGMIKASEHYEPRLLLNGLTSIDEMTLAYLTSNKAIEIPDALKPD